MREMKDSGVAWLGDIDTRFDIKAIGNLFTIKKDIIGREPDQVLSITQRGVKIKDTTSNEGQNAASYAHYQIVNVGDFAMNHMDLLTGWVDISQYEGVTSPDYRVFTLTDNTQVPEYFLRVFQMYYSNRIFYAFGQGAANLGKWRLPRENFVKIAIPCPPVQLQRKIVDEIAAKVSKVDALIANQQAQIEKLKQYKQSLITEIVTKGLNPDTPMKDSKVESIGRIPAHWILKRAKYVATSLVKGKGITKEEVFEDGDIQCVRYGEIYSKYDCAFVSAFSKTKKKIISSPQYISYGDILFAGTGELVEEIGKNIVYLGTEPCLAGGDIVVMSHNQNPEYLNYALYGTCSQTQKSRGKAKLKVVHISATEIGNIVVALPPLDEQEVIAEYLNKKCKQSNKLIAIKKKKMEQLEKYKRSVIFEYVTGKKEVV